MDVALARKELIEAALQECYTCKDIWLNPRVCSNGVHFARTILEGRGDCCECDWMAYVAHAGKMYCSEHYEGLPEEEHSITYWPVQ